MALVKAPADASTVEKPLWDRVLTYTPVVMSVIATLLAGLSSSEMTQAQYERAAGAQNQSRAGDQWSLFQAKRLRGTNYETTLEVIQNLSHPAPFDPGSLRPTAAKVSDALKSQSGFAADAGKIQKDLDDLLNDPASQKILADAAADKPPAITDGRYANAGIASVMLAIESRRPEEELVPLLKTIGNDDFLAAQQVARDNAVAFDAVSKPFAKTLDKLNLILSRQVTLVRSARRSGVAVPAELSESVEQLASDFTAMRIRLATKRYEAEARYNQAIAQLYEVEVHKSNIAAENHRVRSKRFFYGMLAAQCGVIAATLALAVRKKSVLWALASAAGTGALVFGTYVYLT